jgi:CMP-N-acetylneuraminic acid synthetase
MSLLAVIPARGGSKGIPGKNIRPLCGKPLIAWTIEAALRSPSVDRVVVSTEDEDIAEVARQYGAEAPFLRPIALAQDDTPGVEPVLHALTELPGYSEVLLLQPTSPLRTAADIEAIVALRRTAEVPAAVSVSEAGVSPYLMYALDAGSHLAPLLGEAPATRRQDLPPAYALNGALYVADTAPFVRDGSFMTPETTAYVMPPERSVDIDTMLDWHLAEALLTERQADGD